MPWPTPEQEIAQAGGMLAPRRSELIADQPKILHAHIQERAEKPRTRSSLRRSGFKVELEGAANRIDVCHRFGNPADEMLHGVDKWGPDLVVAGRRGLRGPERWLLAACPSTSLEGARCRCSSSRELREDRTSR